MNTKKDYAENIVSRLKQEGLKVDKYGQDYSISTLLYDETTPLFLLTPKSIAQLKLLDQDGIEMLVLDKYYVEYFKSFIDKTNKEIGIEVKINYSDN